MKKLILAFILIFSLSFLCGCTQNKSIEIDKNFVMLSLEQKVDSSCKQSIVFGVNSPFIRENSKSLQEELSFKQNLIKNVDNLRNEFLFSFALIYMQNPIEEFKINQGVLLSQVGYNQEEDYIGFEITFTSSSSWQYYHQSNKDAEDSQKEKQGNIFYQKHQNNGEFPFQNVADKFKNIYISAGEGLSFAENLKNQYNPQYLYNYCTYYPKFHSNADVGFVDNNRIYHHLWIEKDMTNCKPITLTAYTIYKGWWILFTLIISLSIMTILIIYQKYKIRRS